MCSTSITSRRPSTRHTTIASLASILLWRSISAKYGVACPASTDYHDDYGVSQRTTSSPLLPRSPHGSPSESARHYRHQKGTSSLRSILREKSQRWKRRNAPNNSQKQTTSPPPTKTTKAPLLPSSNAHPTTPSPSNTNPPSNPSSKKSNIKDPPSAAPPPQQPPPPRP